MMVGSVLFCIVLFSVAFAAPVRYLPGYGVPSFKQYAGFVTIDESAGSNIFYWFFESQKSNPMQSPVTLWLQGGPGVSSMMGVLAENGPYIISSNTTLVDNPYSWNMYSNMLYIDQPVGSGFSYTQSPNGFPTTEDEVASQLYTALQQFFRLYPQYSNLDFYITGESYAGKYIPSLSSYIHNANKNPAMLKKQANLKINLKGLAIGNGWVHPIVQNAAYVNYPYNLGLIDANQRDQAQNIQDSLVSAIDSEQWILANNLSNALEAFVVTAAGNIDIDNILYPVDPLSEKYVYMDYYLNSPSVRAALNVGNYTWSFENETTENALNADEQQSVLHLLPTLIMNYRVLIYTGNMDMNCNLVGVEGYLNTLQWPYRKQFYTAPRGLWMVDNQLAGYGRSIGNLKGAWSLTNLVVRNAGHEVPAFQPENAYDMFNRFIQGKPYF